MFRGADHLTGGMEPNKIRQKLGISEIQWREVRLKLRRLAGMEEEDDEDQELTDIEEEDEEE